MDDVFKGDAAGLKAAIETLDPQAVRIDRPDVDVIARVLDETPNSDDDLWAGDDWIAKR